MKKNDKFAALAAALIMGVTFLVFFFMPGVMLAAGEISPWLAAAVGALAVLAFFAVFWLRARSGSASQGRGKEQQPKN